MGPGANANGMSMPSQGSLPGTPVHSAPTPGPSAPPSGAMSQQNLNQIVSVAIYSSLVQNPFHPNMPFVLFFRVLLLLISSGCVLCGFHTCKHLHHWPNHSSAPIHQGRAPRSTQKGCFSQIIILDTSTLQSQHATRQTRWQVRQPKSSTSSGFQEEASDDRART